MPSKAVLSLGYPIRVKLLMCLPLAVCFYAVWRIAFGTSPGGWDVVAVAGAMLSSFPAIYGFRSSCEIDSDGITRRSLWGEKRFRREEFLGHERIAAEPGASPDLLIRFKQGVVFLGSGQIDRSAQDVVDFLRVQWQVTAADYEPPVLGAVDPGQCFEYENLHISVLLAAGVISGLIAVQFPVFTLLGLVTIFAFSAAWRAMGRLETSETGLTYSHRYLAPVTVAWSEIEAISYWDSFLQGGVRILGKDGKRISVYRWIDRYPMLDRLMHDRMSNKAFWPTLNLPMRVDLNRRRRFGVLAPYFLLMVNALALLWQGNLTSFTIVLAVPTAVAAVLIWGSSRVVELDKHEARDIWRYMWFKKVSVFRRADLLDARLGRQITVGGLWMRFGDTRLEITNGDASLPPEQILTCLREQWAWDKKTESGGADGKFGSDQMRGAA